MRNLKVFAAGLFKESKDLSPSIFSEFFSKPSAQYDLRHASEFSVLNGKNTFHRNRKLMLSRTKSSEFSSKVA